MQIEITEYFKIVRADEGKLLHNEDTYSPIIYMPFDGDESLWEEVDESECPLEDFIPFEDNYEITEAAE